MLPFQVPKTRKLLGLAFIYPAYCDDIVILLLIKSSGAVLGTELLITNYILTLELE